MENEMTTRNYTVTLEIEIGELAITPEPDEVVELLESSLIDTTAEMIKESMGIESIHIREIIS